MSGNLAIIERIDRAFQEIGVKAMRKALESGRPDDVAPIAAVISEVVDPDIKIDTTQWRGQWPGPTDYHGMAGWLAFWRDWLEPWEEFRYTRIRNEEDEDWLVSDVELSVRGERSGVPVDWRFAQLWRFRDGRITYLATMRDLDAGLEAARGSTGG